MWNTKYELIAPPAEWVLRSVDSKILPAGTRSVKFYLEGGHQSGTGSKTAFDNLEAEIIDNDGQTGAYAFYENRIYECTTAGTTAGSSPVFNTAIDATTADGTVVWTARDSFTRHAVVASVTNNSVFALTITPSAAGSVDDWFNGGQVVFETGLNVGRSMEVRDWDHASSTITLFLDMQDNVQVGDKLYVIPGCNRTRADCRDKFRIPNSTKLANGNVKEFDGEPDVPGPDAILTYPDAT